MITFNINLRFVVTKILSFTVETSCPLVNLFISMCGVLQLNCDELIYVAGTSVDVPKRHASEDVFKKLVPKTETCVPPLPSTFTGVNDAIVTVS